MKEYKNIQEFKKLDKNLYYRYMALAKELENIKTIAINFGQQYKTAQMMLGVKITNKNNILSEQEE